jgi:hypothetical protein
MTNYRHDEDELREKLNKQIELIIDRAETAADQDKGMFAAMDNVPMNRQTIFHEVGQLVRDYTAARVWGARINELEQLASDVGSDEQFTPFEIDRLQMLIGDRVRARTIPFDKES